MTRIVTILTNGFADWECALLNAVAHVFYQLETHFATPGGLRVTSSGGMLVEPDLALEGLDVDGLDALVVCGGSIWQSPEAPDLGPVLRLAAQRGKLIGLICDGTVAAARSGLLDEVAHTSNGAGYLDGTGYRGAVHYRDVPHAVVDGAIITAPGTAPVSFMAEMLRALGKADADLDYYVGLHAAQFAAAA